MSGYEQMATVPSPWVRRMFLGVPQACGNMIWFVCKGLAGVGSGGGVPVGSDLGSMGMRTSS